jgi:flagellar L-ring protein FlgH
MICHRTRMLGPAGAARAAGWVAALALGLGAGFGAPAGAASLWSDESVHFFSNHKAMHVGDIVTVIVVEEASASNKSELKLNKKTSNKLDASGTGALDFVPLMSGALDYQKDHQGKGETTLNGRMNARVTAEVVEIRPNGNLVIEGSRAVLINDDEDQITVRGVLRPEDIAADNTVLSTYLSEAQIAYTGSGPNDNAAKQGIITRILDLIF